MTYNPPKPEKQIVGEIICPGCGHKTPVKLNKNGILFTWCRNEINAETGDKCGHRITWGRTASRKFIRENKIEVLNNGTAGISDIRTIRPESGNDNVERQSTGTEPDFSDIWG